MLSNARPCLCVATTHDSIPCLCFTGRYFASPRFAFAKRHPALPLPNIALRFYAFAEHYHDRLSLCQTARAEASPLPYYSLLRNTLPSLCDDTPCHCGTSLQPTPRRAETLYVALPLLSRTKHSQLCLCMTSPCGTFPLHCQSWLNLT